MFCRGLFFHSHCLRCCSRHRRLPPYSRSHFSSLSKRSSTTHFFVPPRVHGALGFSSVLSQRSLSSTEAIKAVNEILVQVLNSYPVSSMAETLASVHDSTGCSWSMTIAGAAVFLRFGLLLPAQVTSQKVGLVREESPPLIGNISIQYS